MGRVTDRPPIRTAEVIAVGTELLGSTRLDTNSLFLSERLASLGIALRAKTVVGDDRRDVAVCFRQALERADLTILTGGLGPTDDDVTRDAVADVLELPLIEDSAIVERIERRFARRGMHMPEVNRKQGLVLRGASVIDNPNGTAPGLFLEHGDRLVVLLPGPPRELQPMMDYLVAGPLGQRVGRERLFRTTLFVTGRSESHVEQATQPTYSAWRQVVPPIETTILASPGTIELHFVTRTADAEAAKRALDDARDRMVAILGADVFSLDGRPLEDVIGGLLRERGLTIGVAESCTGGLLLSRLTDVPGSSAYVLGGVVAYSNELKEGLADVAPELIATHGAVSEPVAVALAEGIRARTRADIGVGVTGIAGPSGGTPQKPVGTVVVAAIAPGSAARVRTFSFVGGRAQVKFQATQAALDMVRRMLTGH